MCERELKGYTIRLKAVIRETRKGRVKGSMVQAIRKDLEMEVGWEEDENEETVAAYWKKNN